MHSDETEMLVAQIDLPSTASTIEKPAPQVAGSLPETVQKFSLWQRFRSQPRETAAVVVLIVTAIIWLDPGSEPSEIALPADPLESYDSILSQFETSENFDSVPRSSEPFDSISQDSFGGGELVIPQPYPSGFMNTVTADYGDSAATFGPPSADSGGPAAAVARVSSGLKPSDSSATKPTSPRPSGAPNGASADPSRRVRFAGRIKPAN